ncbi:response regulator transcription factor [Natribacillus halophilus]|uniref:DNA-binding response regulator, NarL/FixJ family, contains REC and HTH domains n=1 Tax=Natribacillus halophilus TaxID=549003 RepID=A0A1G8KTI1_9BACI|nr:response regulator transcription factor [Natribacillus halophilus]SDI46682.1 DNA-binding response regulator, NarL/FixJ family, contains REC and HTH domains [Natribacillus halophilus]
MNKGNILIVEDDTATLELLQAYLEKEHYQIVIAKNGKRALEKFRKYDLDLILLDIVLPDMDGLHICRNIRWQSNIPIIFLSGRREMNDIVTGLDVGGDDYITKPFDPDILVARVNANLRRHRYLENSQPDKQPHQPVESLTKREVETLALINRGLTNKDIANRLFLSEGTVKGYNNNIFQKLAVKNRTEAVNLARELGLL